MIAKENSCEHSSSDILCEMLGFNSPLFYQIKGIFTDYMHINLNSMSCDFNVVRKPLNNSNYIKLKLNL